MYIFQSQNYWRALHKLSSWFSILKEPIKETKHLDIFFQSIVFPTSANFKVQYKPKISIDKADCKGLEQHTNFYCLL